MKKVLALLLGILLVVSCAWAEDGSGNPAAPDQEETAVPEFMNPREFMSMFNTMFSMSADMLRDSVGDEEADRLVETYSLTQYDFDRSFIYYGSTDWMLEAAFVFENEEDVSPDAPALQWYLFLNDTAEENAWRLAMYSLNLMLGYTYKDSVGTDAILEWFQTVQLGDTLEFPDGRILSVFRGENCTVFSMTPAGTDSVAEE